MYGYPGDGINGFLGASGQAKHLAKALVNGGPAAGDIVRHSLRGKLKELVTR